jgi:hypothetical protein
LYCTRNTFLQPVPKDETKLLLPLVVLLLLLDDDDTPARPDVDDEATAPTLFVAFVDELLLLVLLSYFEDVAELVVVLFDVEEVEDFDAECSTPKLAVSQIRMVPSTQHDTICLPSGRHVKFRTMAV